MAFVRHAVVGMWAALLLWSPGVAWAATSLQVEAFDVEQVPQLAAGVRLNFSVFGSAGASAVLHIHGARHPLELREVQPGIYEGSYTLDDSDRIEPDSRVIATLRRGPQLATTVLDEPLQLGASPPVAAAAPPPVPAAERVCDDCAVVESIRAVEVGGLPVYVGTVAGDLLVALIGDPTGPGDDRHASRTIGTPGGAVVGREVGRRVGSRIEYDVVLRRPGGATQMRRYYGMPPFSVGDTIRLDPGRP